MPSLIPILCNMPRAQKDTLGCEDITKVKHCANHVKNAYVITEQQSQAFLGLRR
jgi:hypothetical protein